MGPHSIKPALPQAQQGKAPNFHFKGAGFDYPAPLLTAKYSPTSLQFPPKFNGSGLSVVLLPPGPCSKLLISIQQDNSKGAFTAAFIQVVVPTVDDPGNLLPGELPGTKKGTPPPIGAKSGKGPQTAVKQYVTLPNPTVVTDPTQPLNLSVIFHAPSAPGHYSAKVVITGDGWNPIEIPLSATALGDINVGPLGNLSIAQGADATLPIKITSNLIAQTIVTASLASDIPGLTMQPLQSSIDAGSTINQTLAFHADPQAALVSGAPLAITLGFAVGYETRTPWQVAGQVTVTPGPMTVDPTSAQLKLYAGSTASLDFSIAVTGSATEVYFSVDGSLPAGITCPAVAVPVGAGGTTTATLTFYAQPDAAIFPEGLNFTINWYAYDKAVLGGCALVLSVEETFFISQQLTSQWCWAAVTSSIDRFYRNGSAITQCALASLFLPFTKLPESDVSLFGNVLEMDFPTPKPPVAKTDCCATPTPAECVFAYSLKQALSAVHLLPGDEEGPLPPDILKNQTDNKHPVAIRIKWNDSNTAHAIVCAGVDVEGLVVMHDPGNGDGNETAMPYAALLNNYAGHGTWTHSYRTSL